MIPTEANGADWKSNPAFDDSAWKHGAVANDVTGVGNHTNPN